MNRCLSSLASLFLGLTCGAAGCALGTAWWAQTTAEVKKLNVGEINVGLWLACSKLPGSDETCELTIDEGVKDNEWFIATIAAQCGGTLFVVIAQILWIVLLCKKGTNTGMKIVTILFAMLACGCFVAAILIWKMKVLEGETYKLLEVAWSFWVCVGAAGAAGIAVILCIVSSCSDSRTSV